MENTFTFTSDDVCETADGDTGGRSFYFSRVGADPTQIRAQCLVISVESHLTSTSIPHLWRACSKKFATFGVSADRPWYKVFDGPVFGDIAHVNDAFLYDLDKRWPCGLLALYSRNQDGSGYVITSHALQGSPDLGDDERVRADVAVDAPMIANIWEVDAGRPGAITLKQQPRSVPRYIVAQILGEPNETTKSAYLRKERWRVLGMHASLPSAITAAGDAAGLRIHGEGLFFTQQAPFRVAIDEMALFCDKLDAAAQGADVLPDLAWMHDLLYIGANVGEDQIAIFHTGEHAAGGDAFDPVAYLLDEVQAAQDAAAKLAADLDLDAHCDR